MLLCACPEIDHRWPQKVVRTNKCHRCSYHVLMSPLIYNWTDTWQHWIFLFSSMHLASNLNRSSVRTNQNTKIIWHYIVWHVLHLTLILNTRYYVPLNSLLTTGCAEGLRLFGSSPQRAYRSFTVASFCSLAWMLISKAQFRNWHRCACSTYVWKNSSKDFF